MLKALANLCLNLKFKNTLSTATLKYFISVMWYNQNLYEFRINHSFNNCSVCQISHCNNFIFKYFVIKNLKGHDKNIPSNKLFWTILYLLPTKWSDWNKLHTNETVPILLWQICSNSGEVCLSEVFIVSNAAWIFQTNSRLFKPIC